MLAFARDGQSLAVAAGGRLMRLDAETGSATEWPGMPDDKPKFVSALAFSPDGLELATGQTDGRVRIWPVDPSTGRVKEPGQHNGAVHALAYEPGGRRLASGGDDWMVRLWDLETESELATYEGHIGPIFCLAFAANGSTLVSGGATAEGSGQVLVWRTDHSPAPPANRVQTGPLIHSARPESGPGAHKMLPSRH